MLDHAHGGVFWLIPVAVLRRSIVRIDTRELHDFGRASWFLLARCRRGTQRGSSPRPGQAGPRCSLSWARHLNIDDRGNGKLPWSNTDTPERDHVISSFHGEESVAHG